MRYWCVSLLVSACSMISCMHQGTDALPLVSIFVAEKWSQAILGICFPNYLWIQLGITKLCNRFFHITKCQQFLLVTNNRFFFCFLCGSGTRRGVRGGSVGKRLAFRYIISNNNNIHHKLVNSERMCVAGRTVTTCIDSTWHYLNVLSHAAAKVKHLIISSWGSNLTPSLTNAI